MKLFPLVLLLVTWKKRPSPTWLQPPLRFCRMQGYCSNCSLAFPFPETEFLQGKHDVVASKQYLCIMGLVSTLLHKLMVFGQCLKRPFLSWDTQPFSGIQTARKWKHSELTWPQTPAGSKGSFTYIYTNTRAEELSVLLSLQLTDPR